MPLTDLLSPDRVSLLDAAVDRDAVLDAAARLLTVDARDETAAVAGCLRQRERLGSTGIGHGVAIPHGRSPAFEAVRGAFLRLREPVPFGADDDQPVDLVFAMAVPEHFTQLHLQLLSELAEVFAEPGFRDSLRGAADAAALHAVLQRGHG